MASWGDGPPFDRCLDFEELDELELLDELPLKSFEILLILAAFTANVELDKIYKHTNSTESEKIRAVSQADELQIFLLDDFSVFPFNPGSERTFWHTL